MKKLILLGSILLSFISINTASANPMLAQYQIPVEYKPEYAVNFEIDKDSSGKQKNHGRAAIINVFMYLLAGALIYLAAPMAVIMIAVGGLRYVVSLGDQSAVDEAKKNITYAIIGLIVIAISWILVHNITKIIIEIE
jgi:hypothetical protein